MLVSQLTYRELKRLDSVSRSPIYALLGETVDGVAVVRAFSAQEGLQNRLKGMLDRQQHAYFLTCTAQSWLAIRLELIGTSIITFAPSFHAFGLHFSQTWPDFPNLARMQMLQETSTSDLFCCDLTRTSNQD